MRKLALPFRRTRELEVLNLLKEHINLCTLTVKMLENIFKTLPSCSSNELFSSIGELYKIEENADKIRRKVANELAKDILPPLYREDLMQLIEKVDLIADLSKDIGRILITMTACKRFRIHAHNVCKSILKKLSECSNTTKECLISLLYDLNKTVKLSYEIETIEEEIDSLYVNALKYLYESKLPANELLPLYELIKSLEEIADLCEDAGDIAKVIAIRSLK